MSNIYGISLVSTPNSNLAITLGQAKQQLVISSTFTDDDAYITGLISAAQTHVENLMQRAMFNQQYLLTLDYFPYPYAATSYFPNDRGGWYAPQYWRRFGIKLPYPKVQTVDSITYTNLGNQTVTVDPSTYYLDNNQDLARVTPVYGTYWPYTSTAQSAAIKVTYTSGTWGDGATVNNTPWPVQQAIMMLVSHMYQNRDAAMSIPMKEMDFSVNALINNYKAESFLEQT